MLSALPSLNSDLRAASASSVAKPPCRIHATAIVADKAIFIGSHHIEIGEHSVIHPYATIRAEGGAVTIGAYCTISEGAIVGPSAGRPGTITLEDRVVIDGGAQVEAALVGSSTEVGVKAIVGHGAVLGKHCKIAPKRRVKPGQTLEDYTVVYGDDLVRRDTSTMNNSTYRDAHLLGQERHVELLGRKIPNAAARFSTLPVES